DPVVVRALSGLYGPAAAGIDAANNEIIRRLDTGVPMLHEVRPAGEVVPGLDLDARVLLHCGPRIDWARVCDPLRRSMRAAVVAEGWADDVAGADRLLADGEVALEPANLHSAVVPMATSIGPSAPVFVVRMDEGDTTAYSAVNQGPGNVAWFGRDTDEAIARLVLLRDVVGPALADVLASSGPLDVFSLAGQGVQMGDDVHMRTQASTNLFIRAMLPHLVELDAAVRRPVAEFLSSNHLFFLNIAMAAAKSLTLWAEQVDGGSIITTMSRNGTDFGVRLAGSDTWHITDAPPIGDALYYADQGPETSAPDIGDSAVLELVGLGGPAAAGSPAVAAFLGGTMADAARATEEMAAICVAGSTKFKLPTLSFRGTPLGVDVRRVVELGITPKVNTGILHASAGTGQVGAGVATAPVECFREALLDLTRRVAPAYAA
ncbi:MAG TPA: DUF1116 domain-containing protein, partial [Actinomycetes bacterium]|nr:DUF1116 domain-containing protein [Actinomycetes bacterium]